MEKPPSDNRRKRRTSARVCLVVISAAAIATLVGCTQDETRRDVYANKDDCLADWGNSPADCEPAYDHPHSRGANTAYYGRPYIYGGSAGSPSRTGKTIGSSSSTSRSGFGSSGKSASSNGG